MIGCFLTLTLLFCFKSNMDTDLYWHMATGRWILENWQFPYQDTFSFIYNGAEWVNLTWLFQIVSHLSMQQFDYAGVLLFCSLLYMASTLLGWLSYRSMSEKTPTVFIWLFYCLLFLWIEKRWVPRPEALTHFFLTLEIFILIRFCLSPQKTKILWTLPILMVLWTNSHGMFILGLILFGFVFLKYPRQTGLPFGASILATLANPYGWHGATYPFYLRKVSADPIYRLIQEGMSFMDPGVSWSWYVFWGLWLFLVLFSIRPGFRVMGWIYFLWLAFAVYFSTTMVRNLSPAVVMTAPFILVGLENLWSKFSERSLHCLKTYRWVCVLFLTSAMCFLVVSGKIENLRDNFQFGWKISQNESLHEAGDFFLKTNKENIFSTPEFSNYMLWRQPGFKTYIDTRYAEVVPRDHFQKMFQLFLNPVQIEQEALRHRLPVIAINHTLANYHGAIRYFLSSQNWRAVYADHFMIFFFHKSHHPEIETLKVQEFLTFLKNEVQKWKESKPWQSQTEKIKKIYQILVAATIFRQEQEVLSTMQSLENEMDLKLNNLYCSILAYSSRATTNNENKRAWAQKAVDICQTVYDQNKDQSAAFNRAAASYILGDLSSAQEWIERALELNKTVFGFHLLKAEILTAQGATQNFKVIETSYKEALHLNPFQPQIWQELLRLQRFHKTQEEARATLQKAQKFYPEIK